MNSQWWTQERVNFNKLKKSPAFGFLKRNRFKKSIYKKLLYNTRRNKYHCTYFFEKRGTVDNLL